MGKKELERCSLTKLDGGFWRDERKERALGSVLAQVDVHGKPGAWRGNIRKIPKISFSQAALVKFIYFKTTVRIMFP